METAARGSDVDRSAARPDGGIYTGFWNDRGAQRRIRWEKTAAYKLWAWPGSLMKVRLDSSATGNKLQPKLHNVNVSHATYL